MILHTIGCPLCDVLKEKLESKKITFEINTDEDKMAQLGITQVPVLQLDSGELLEFSAANKYINSLEAN